MLLTPPVITAAHLTTSAINAHFCATTPRLQRPRRPVLRLSRQITVVVVVGVVAVVVVAGREVKVAIILSHGINRGPMVSPHTPVKTKL
jgi:hypothetical protein